MWARALPVRPGASRAPLTPPPPTFRGLAYPDDGRIAVVVWAAPSDVGEPVLLLPGARFGKVVAQWPGPSCGKRPNPVAAPTRRCRGNGGPRNWWWMRSACRCRCTASKCP